MLKNHFKFGFGKTAVSITILILALFIMAGFRSSNPGLPYPPRSEDTIQLTLADAVAFADQIPLFSVNLNNYKHPSNPILAAGEKGQWDEAGIERVVVIRLANEDWRMWYSCAGKLRAIGLATSKDGIHWIKHPGNPVLKPAEPWRMIYTAFGLHGQWNGLAESADGITWQKTKAPIAIHSGFYTRATGYHLNSGQTIRCPVRIGNVWAALSYELDAWDSAPAIGLSLDNWVTLGKRILYANQDYEGPRLAPYAMEADEQWFYLYYSTGRQSVGLVRAPKRSVHQPIIVWENQLLPPAGCLSKILEPDRRSFTLHLFSERKGILQLVVWNPAANTWLELDPEPVDGGQLFSLDPLPLHAKLRLKFAAQENNTSVSAWIVPE